MAVKNRKNKQNLTASAKKKADELKRIAEEKKQLLLKKKLAEQEESEDDDDDDDDDVDSDDVDSDGEEVEEADDDDDEEEDEDDEEDDEEDEDDEEELPVKNGKKVNSNQKTAPQKRKLEESPTSTPSRKKKVGFGEEDDIKTPLTPKQIKKETADKKAPATSDFQQTIESRTRDRDIRSLFIRGFPNGTDVQVIKNLSKDILDVRMPKRGNSKKGPTIGFGFMEFKNEAVADANYKKLQKVKIEGRQMLIDYAGVKSKTKPVSKRTEGAINKKKLYVGGLTADVTQEDLKDIFPKVVNYKIVHRGMSSFACMTYKDEVTAAADFEKGQDLELKNKKLTVLFSKVRSRDLKHKERRNKKKAELKKKKSAKGGDDDEEEEMEEDDDDEEDEEDDDDEDDDE